IRLIVESMLPSIAKTRIAKFCDCTCVDDSIFTKDQCRKVLVAAQKLGFDLKVHADEFAPVGGAELAAEVGATSADHLLYTSDVGLAALARSQTIAVLLPATPFSLMVGRYADAREMISRGIPVALGTDLSPA